jgi:regulator of sigma E protease
MNWVLIFLGFSLLIVLHEAGHFVAAKATGMRVERFFLFFPPKLVSVKRGETEYGIGALPLGGFVRISGMNPDEELPPEAKGRGYYDQPVWKRIVVIGAGPAVNIVLAFAILFALSFQGSEPDRTVDQVVPGTPAAGKLKAGDEILAIDGKNYRNLDGAARIERFRDRVASHKCAGKQVDGCRAAVPTVLTVKRDGHNSTIPVRPEYDADAGQALLGFRYGLNTYGRSAGAAVGNAANVMWEISSRTTTIFSRIFEKEKREELSGPVGISGAANEVLDVFGAREALVLLALVSLSLGLINLFPFLPLDGGHIFWSLVEKARGKRVSFAVMERASVVGFVLVMMLFVIGLSNDIGRLNGDGFGIR